MQNRLDELATSGAVTSWSWSARGTRTPCEARL